MSEDQALSKKVSFTSPKNELWKAYKELEKKLSEKEELQLKPQKIVEEKAKKETIQKVETLSFDSVSKAVQSLKSESTLLLGKLQENLEREIKKYEDIQKAISVKDNELKEIFEIEKSAYALAALIEAQNEKKREFEEELNFKKETVLKEAEKMRNDWENEKKLRELETAEWEEKEKKRRQREKEEFDYLFKREKQQEHDKFKDQLLKEEKEFNEKILKQKSELDRREAEIKEREKEYETMKIKIGNFEKDSAATINKTVEETTKKLNAEAKNKIDLIQKEFEGEKNVLITKITSLEKLCAEQEKKIEEITKKLDTAYQKVQDVAVKAIESSSSAKIFSELQSAFIEKSSGKSKE